MTTIYHVFQKVAEIQAAIFLGYANEKIIIQNIIKSTDRYIKMFEELYQKCKTAGALVAGYEKLNACIASHIKDEYTIKESDVGAFVSIKGYEINTMFRAYYW